MRAHVAKYGTVRAHVAKYWDAVRWSYWFVPSLMALAAALLSFATTALDVWLAPVWRTDGGWLSLNNAAGARVLLSTIAGSMITVAGVTFSITIAAVAYATSQLGPRLLGNFMRDTSNQVTLGTFIATFVYCLLVLRTVHGGVADADGTRMFVPHLGLLLALCLTLASLGVLIYFIHHVPRSIQASQVIAQIGEELTERLAVLFPGRLGAPPPDDVQPVETADAYPDGSGAPVLATATGYLTHLDDRGLLQLARSQDLVLRLVRQPGDFVAAGETLAYVHGNGDGDVRSAVRIAFAFGRERTQSQDVLFVVQQLVEIAIRALSPGVNDPFTAIRCLNWLGGALVDLGCRAPPSGCRYDDDGRLRVIAPGLGFDQVAAAVFDTLRPYVSGDRNAALHAMAVLERVLTGVTHPPYRARLLEHAAALQAGAEDGLTQRRDREQLAAAYERLTGNAPDGTAGGIA